jgi:hypothetical protein
MVCCEFLAEGLEKKKGTGAFALSELLTAKYKNGVLDLVCQEALQDPSVRLRQNFPIKGAVLTYVRKDSGEVVGAEIIRVDEALSEVVASVKALGLKTRYDVPQLGLYNAPLEVVLRRCYEEYVHTP